MCERIAGQIGLVEEAGDGLVRLGVRWFADCVLGCRRKPIAMTAANEICRMDAVTLVRRVRAKELSPVEVVDAVLGRLERLDPVLRAFTTVTADDARAEARCVEQDIAAGWEVGPLAGVLTGVKDLICTKGVRMSLGSCAYAGFIPDEDDVVVERIKGGWGDRDR
jgi:aspartyl-tRNA(Asn)/glutamyl-tRNA(Gln) amidotransferase subunit A